MKFKCNKKDFCEAVNIILPAVSSKSTIASLEGILLNCKNNNLTLTGYNLELGITKNIEVSTIEEGSIILNATLLANIVNKMPDETLSISSDEKLLTLIDCGEVEFTILGLNADEFPEIPIINNDKSFTIENELLRSMISQTLFSVAQNDQIPIHTGSLFDIKGGVLNIVSVDGFRLALRKEKINTTEELKFVVPGKTLAEIVKILSRLVLEEDDEKINISVFNKHISFSVSGYIIISRLLEGDFLDYKSAIPVESTTNVKIETKHFLESINRAAIIINERAKSPIKCSFSKDNVKLFCETSIGKINDTIPVSIEGPEVKIGFNNRYMADALKATECDKILMQINGPISPIKIVPVDDDSFLFLVLPVRLMN